MMTKEKIDEVTKLALDTRAAESIIDKEVDSDFSKTIDAVFNHFVKAGLSHETIFNCEAWLDKWLNTTGADLSHGNIDLSSITKMRIFIADSLKRKFVFTGMRMRALEMRVSS